MDLHNLPMAELRKRIYQLIAKEFGPANLIRFIQDHSMGSGDYTKDRHKWLPKKTVEELAEDLQKWKKEQENNRTDDRGEH